MSAGRRVKLGVAAVAVAVASVLLPALPASAAVGSTVTGWGDSTNFWVTDGFPTASCSNRFTGVVTADDGNGGIVARIDNVRITCHEGDVTITANTPWTLKLKDGFLATFEGFDVNFTTSEGTCRYRGTVPGGLEFPPGIYNFYGSLTRLSAGCGAGEEISVAEGWENIGVSG